MSLDQPPSNKMMQSATDKKEFHFSGGGIWRNATILAATIQEAEELWHATKQLINPAIPVAAIKAETPVEQFTPTPEPQSSESEVQ